MKFWKKKKPAWKIQLGMDVKRCAECNKYERPCLADGTPATFHRWVEEESALLQIDACLPLRDQQKIVHRFREEKVLDPFSKIEKLRTCFALVEYPDGSVGKVKPELIQFLDRKEV